MSIEDLQTTADSLRSVELRGAIRGVDAERARKLLDWAADALEAAAREQKELRGELERLREANDEDAVGKALLAATRAGEEILAEARKRAASITAEAEAQASALLARTASLAEEREQEEAAAREQFERQLSVSRSALAKGHDLARAETEERLADARRELARLETEAARLRSAVTDTQRRVVEIAQTALDELESLRADTSRGAAEADLLRDLRPALDRAANSAGNAVD